MFVIVVLKLGSYLGNVNNGRANPEKDRVFGRVSHYLTDNTRYHQAVWSCTRLGRDVSNWPIICVSHHVDDM